jgi:archaemetzincin
MHKTIYLTQIGKLDRSKIDDLRKNLEAEFNEFNMSVELLKKKIKLRKIYFNTVKKQYKAQKILDSLLKKAKQKEYFRILGIFDKDIYSKDFDFNFGVASIGSCAALISISRLRENFYVESSDLYRKLESPEKLNDRILKEAKHELGHTFGLKHCDNICVMHKSNSLADIDKKPVEFCESCLTKINIFLT